MIMNKNTYIEIRNSILNDANTQGKLNAKSK